MSSRSTGHLRGVMVAAVTVSLIASCSESIDPPLETPETPRASGSTAPETDTTTTPSPVTTIPQEVVAVDINPCDLLTWDEVEAWTGFPRAEDEPELREGLFDNLFCVWWTASDEERVRGIQLTVWSSDDSPSARGQVESLHSVTGVEPIVDHTELTGDVFVFEAVSESYEAGTILHDHLAVSVWTFGIGGGQFDSIEEEQQVQFDAIRIALTRLPR